MSRLLRMSSSNREIIFDNDDRYDLTIDIDGRLFTIQDLVFTQLDHNNATTGTHYVKWSPMTLDEIARQNEAAWLSYKYSIMPIELAEDGSRITPLKITLKHGNAKEDDVITFDCGGKLERPSVKLDPSLFTSIHAFSEDGGTNAQDEDFLWYIENFSKLYDQYGLCYVAIKK